MWLIGAIWLKGLGQYQNKCEFMQAEEKQRVQLYKKETHWLQRGLEEGRWKGWKCMCLSWPIYCPCIALELICQYALLSTTTTRFLYVIVIELFLLLDTYQIHRTYVSQPRSCCRTVAVGSSREDDEGRFAVRNRLHVRSDNSTLKCICRITRQLLE